MHTTNSIHLYFDLPKLLFSEEKVIFCAGHLDTTVQYEKVDLLANQKVIGTVAMIPQYVEGLNDVALTGFVVSGRLSDVYGQEEVVFALRFSFGKKVVEHEIGRAKVIKTIKKIETKKSDSVAICLPLYNPDIVRFEKQLSSILEQSYTSIEVIIQDDGSDESVFEKVKNIVADFPNVHLLLQKENVGFYHNIETLLYQVGDSFKYVAFSDQDDVWEKDKIEKEVNQLEQKKIDLVYSDLRIVDGDLNTIRDSFWHNRSNHLNDFNALCLKNVATGSTMLFKKNWLSNVLPFPQKIGKVYHDHWICAQTKKIGNIGYIDEPLVNYIQHGDNVTGYHEFKNIPISQRLMAFISLKIIFLKLLFKKDISSLKNLILDNHKIYYTEGQRLKLFYVKLNHKPLESINSKWTDVSIIKHNMLLSIKTLVKKIFFNRSEVAIYTAFVVHFALRIRTYFRKRNG